MVGLVRHNTEGYKSGNCGAVVCRATELTGGVHDELAAERVVTGIHELVVFALAGDANGLVGDELIAAEAIVEFDNVNVLGLGASLGVDIRGRSLGHWCSETEEYVSRKIRLTLEYHSLSKPTDFMQESS